MDMILVVTTGGTIDKVYFDAQSEFEVGRSMVGDLLREAHVHVPFETLEVVRKDSLDLTDDDRDAIRRAIAAAPNARVVVTHGTDTMTKTARVLGSIRDKTIVLTGALSPARFANTDAGVQRRDGVRRGADVACRRLHRHERSGIRRSKSTQGSCDEPFRRDLIPTASV